MIRDFNVNFSHSNNSLSDCEEMMPSDTFSAHGGLRVEPNTEPTTIKSYLQKAPELKMLILCVHF
jgi:hypothetical protein